MSDASQAAAVIKRPTMSDFELDDCIAESLTIIRNIMRDDSNPALTDLRMRAAVAFVAIAAEHVKVKAYSSPVDKIRERALKMVGT
jgi:hypothetical protein